MAAKSLLVGAWEAHSGLDYTVVMLPGEGTDDASIQVHGDEAERLAHQLAATPDLYASLKELERWVTEDSDRPNQKQRHAGRLAIIAARAALAKATGASS